MNTERKFSTLKRCTPTLSNAQGRIYNYQYAKLYFAIFEMFLQLNLIVPFNNEIKKYVMKIQRYCLASRFYQKSYWTTYYIIQQITLF